MTAPPECIGCGREFRDDCPVCGGLIPGSFDAACAELGASLREFEQRLRESTSPALTRCARLVARLADSWERRHGPR